MKIFDRVTSKRIGPPMVGTVIGIYSAKDLMIEASPIPYLDEKYPNWKDGLLVQVKYDKPQRPISFDEFFETIRGATKELDGFGDIKTEEIEMLYQNTIKLTKVAVYPLEDLEWI